MRVTCTNCGGAHTPWDCKRPAKKSTAAKKVSPRIDRQVPETSGKLYGSGESPAGEMSRSAGASKQRVAESVAGTQALPVDTNSLQYQDASSGNADGSKPLTQTKPADPTKRPRGRPKSITDMKTYKAAKQREYRAKWKGRE